MTSIRKQFTRWWNTWLAIDEEGWPRVGGWWTITGALILGGGLVLIIVIPRLWASWVVLAAGMIMVIVYPFGPLLRNEWRQRG